MRKPIMSWDECEIADAFIEDTMNADSTLTEEKAKELVWGDNLLWEDEWIFLCEHLTEVMAKKNKHLPYWKADVNGFGWRSLNGYKYFKAETGSELLQAILPKTDCTFRIYNEGRGGLDVQNFHHDSCTGAEHYHIRPATQKEIENEEFH